MVVAMVVTRAPVDEDEVRAYCRAQGLSGYKVPRRVVTLDDMGRAPNGKADYTTLRERAVAELGIDA
jgi:fatty-acyl-CoA synthase